MPWPFTRRRSSSPPPAYDSLEDANDPDNRSEDSLDMRIPGSSSSSSHASRRSKSGSSSSNVASFHGRMPTGNTSSFGAIFILSSSALGAAITNFPYAYLTAGGVLNGVLIQSAIAVLVFVSLQILSVAAEKYHGTAYEVLIGHMWGRYWRHTVEVIILLYAFFSSIMYLILLGDQMDYVIDNFIPLAPGAVDNADRFREIAIVVSAIIVLPLCIPSDISYLSYPGFLSVIAIIYMAVIIVIRYFDLPYDASDFAFEPDWPTMLSSVPPFMFGYHCHLSAVPLFASLKNRSRANWALVTLASLLIVSTLYFVVGIFGYFTFGSSVHDDVLLGYETRDKAITFGRFMLLCCIITAYPIMHYVGRSALMSMFSPSQNRSTIHTSINQSHSTMFHSFTPFWLLFTLAAALFIPQIEIVIGPIGACAAFFVLGFPGLCLLKLSEDSKWWLPQVLLVLLLVALSVFIFTSTSLKPFL